MTVDEKMAVCYARYTGGLTMHSIAESMGLTRQAISVFFCRAEKMLPSNEAYEHKHNSYINAPMPKLDPDKQEKFFRLVAERKCSEENIKAIGMTVEDATKVLAYLVSNKPKVPHSKNYAELSEWMYVNGKTLTWMANQIGVTRKYMSDFMNDLRLMRDKTARRVSEITGIPLNRLPTAEWGKGSVAAMKTKEN